MDKLHLRLVMIHKRIQKKKLCVSVKCIIGGCESSLHDFYDR